MKAKRGLALLLAALLLLSALPAVSADEAGNPAEPETVTEVAPEISGGGA